MAVTERSLGAESKGQTKSASTPQPSTERSEEAVRPARPFFHFFRSLRAQFILPYAALTAVTAVVGLYVVTQLLVGSIQERFINQLGEASRVAADGVVRRERLHLETLRRLTFTVGVAPAIQADDVDTLQEILGPQILNDRIDALTVVNADGQEVLSLLLNSEDNTLSPSFGSDLSQEPLVREVLTGEYDELGDKFADVRVLNDGSYLFTSAPVRDPGGTIVGVMLMGTRLNGLFAELKTQALADIVALDRSGSTVTAMTFPIPEEGLDVFVLTPAETKSILDRLALPRDADQAPVLNKSLTLNERQYEFLYAPLVVRQSPVGFLAVSFPRDYVIQTASTSRNTFVMLFSAILLIVVVAGLALYRYIVSALLRLRSVSQEVASGNYQAATEIRRQDEIGELAAAFDVMIGRLRERTAEAKRLYEESLQRNAQLADINARLQTAQQQLIQSEKLAAVGQLTAGIVHDVKNPLAVIKGLTEILQEEDNLDPFTREQLTNIRDNATRANAIVTDLLTFARQSTPEMRERDLRETVQAALRLNEYLVRRARINAALDLPAEPVIVTYDGQQIEQVLINLIQNAVQAMPNGGQLNLRLIPNEQHVTLRVSDTGVGIPTENLNRIFDPFFTTKGDEGTGLGLSVSYGIVSRHHGEIRVESEVGQGTTFIITLPVQQPDSVQAGD